MAKRVRTVAATGGAAWQRLTGQRSVGLTLPPNEVRQLKSLAGEFDLSAAEFCRRLVRGALKCRDNQDLKILEKLLGMA